MKIKFPKRLKKESKGLNQKKKKKITEYMKIKKNSLSKLEVNSEKQNKIHQMSVENRRWRTEKKNDRREKFKRSHN